MPVALKSVSSPQDAMSITLDDYKTGRQNFVDHYYRSGCNTAIGGQDLQITWSSLQSAVNTFITKAGTTEVGLRMVYCYDVATNALYLRIQICQMAAVMATPGSFALVNANADWYKIVSGALVACPTETTLANAPYLANMYYCATPPCTGTNSQQLAADTAAHLYARTITFPWTEEVLQLYTDNGSPTGASICFGATSYVHANSGDSNISYPHGLVLYLKDSSGTAMLNNDKDYVCVFHNKGVDYGTLCPARCGVYVLPS